MKIFIFIVFTILVIFAIIGIGVSILLVKSYIEDIKNFNHGKCVCCGKDLEFFHIYYNGERGYQCPNCGRHITIIHAVDKKYLKMKTEKIIEKEK